uniref:ATP-binding cassette sub-family A member 5-like n=1 Tax=Phallusia mammillata TaxID=59560 RepID=A0A6F9D592_9ASCI|nr:ATP-binding cassette sub-family A member 5-like [Phallusia mammillata]
MGSLTWRQIRTLLYRNFLMKKRIKGPTIQEMIMPIYFVVLLVILKLAAYKPTTFPYLPNNETVAITAKPIPQKSPIYVAPDFPQAQQLMQHLKNTSLNNITYRFFATREEMDIVYKNTSALNPVGIYFPQANDVSQYALRFPYGSLPGQDPFDRSETTCRDETGYCPSRMYLDSGFTYLQSFFDAAIVQFLHNSSYLNPIISAQKYPKLPGTSNSQTFQIISSLYLVLAFSPFLTFLLVFIVFEKQKKIKEAMKMMGLSNISLWSAWALTYIIIIFIMTIIITLLAKFGQLFPNSDFFLLFLLFFMYGLTLEMMGFMLTPFFNNPKAAGGLGSLLTICMSLLSLLPVLTTISTPALWALSLLSPVAFAVAIGQVSLLDISGGAFFSNIWVGQNPVGVALVMLPVDILLYFVITLYLDNVVPGEYGQHENPLFCILPSFWCPSKKKAVHEVYSSDTTHSDNIEKIDETLIGKEAIRIKNVSKVYKSDGFFTKQTEATTALKNLSMDIYEGQITALLGHNGAGKTTLFNILTGFIETTSGSATVFDYDVSNPGHMAKIRQMTGVCPQHNILIDQLSVEEHLEIFAGIKGIDPDTAKPEITRVIKLIGLETQRHTFAQKLSGGQKRKLSVGIAIMGDPKILVLDEPTAGMDPFSRNNLWDVLRSRKEGKVTLLTTHFMDEADILADRKAIISRGQLQCLGSSLFLKNRFGVGYHLGVVAKSSDSEPLITECVSSHITGSELLRASGFELGYTLPLAEVSKFSELFNDLERRGENLNVQSFGVSMTTLEEVFLRIGEDEETTDTPSEHEEGPLLANQISQRLRSMSSSYENPSYGATEKETQIQNGDTVVQVVRNNTAFDPSHCVKEKKSRLKLLKILAWRMCLVYVRNPAAVIFGVVFPLGLCIGAAALMTLQTGSQNTDNPDLVFINSTNYRTMLYKNSSESSLDLFTSNTNMTLQLDDLTNLNTSNTWMAADIKLYTIKQMNYKAVFNTTGTYSLPAIINVLSSSVVSMFNKTASPIKTYNKLWPAINPIPPFNGGVFGGVLMAGMALLIPMSFAAFNAVQERELKITTQLRVSGVTFELYWLASFFVDYLWFFIVALAFVIAVLAFQVPLFTSGALGAVVLLFFGWGASGVLFSYCGNFIFDKYETAQATWFNIMQLATLIPYLIVSLLDQLGSTDAALYINIVFVILLPPYVGFSGIYYILKIYTIFALTGVSAIPTHLYFDWTHPMVPFAILMAYVHVFVMFFLLIVFSVLKDGGNVKDILNLKFRYRAIGDSQSQISVREEVNNDDVDNDVKEEKQKVARIVANEESGDQPVVLVHHLHKNFVKRNKRKNCKKTTKADTIKTAVGDLSLTVYPGQVLGLLGPNGAGKTTAMSMMTADIAPTSGKIFISGHEIQSNLSSVYEDMGYCSQDNPLWENITLKEHLEIYAATHGIKKSNIEDTVNSFIDALGVQEHTNKRAKSLSGGTKRKLCFAMAMMGNPQVVLLDEPSTGMDPKTKRFMWDTISTAFEGTSRGAILTTHYMEEADALCSRVAIMVLGNLKCIGSTQHLKSKFGQGYILEVKLKRVDTDSGKILHEFVQKLFPEIANPEEFSNRFVYKVAQDNVVSLSTVFSQFESAKEELGIEEYSFSQSTLEQVFLQFAREQEHEEIRAPEDED